MPESEPQSSPCIAGVGTILVDYLAQADAAFLASAGGLTGGSSPVSAEESAALMAGLSNIQRVPGGSAPNTLAALAAWGIRTRLIGMTGYDDDGDFCRAAFADTSGFKYHPELPTGRCISLVSEDGERTMRTMLGASVAMTGADIAAADFEGASLLLFEGYLFYNQELSQAVLKLAESMNLPVAFDLSSHELAVRYRNEMKTALRKVEILFANRDEAVALLGQGSDEELLAGLAAYAPLAVLKLGRRGAMISRNGKIIKIEPDLVDQPVDTTGAGDLWQAGFLYGYLRNKPLELCGRFAASASAELVKIMGARLPADTLETLLKQFTILEKTYE